MILENNRLLEPLHESYSKFWILNYKNENALLLVNDTFINIISTDRASLIKKIDLKREESAEFRLMDFFNDRIYLFSSPNLIRIINIDSDITHDLSLRYNAIPTSIYYDSLNHLLLVGFSDGHMFIYSSDYSLKHSFHVSDSPILNIKRFKNYNIIGNSNGDLFILKSIQSIKVEKFGNHDSAIISILIFDSFLITASIDGIVNLWDENLNLLESTSFDEHVFDLSHIDNSSFAMLGSSSLCFISVISLDGNLKLKTWLRNSHSNDYGRISFFSNKLYYLTDRGLVYEYSISEKTLNSKRLFAVNLGSLLLAEPFFISNSKDPKFLLAANSTGLIFCLEYPDLILCSFFVDIKKKIVSALFNSDSNMLILGTDDGSVEFYNLDFNGCLKHYSTIKGHTNAVTSICISSSSDFLITGSSDLTIKKWNLATSASIWVIKAHDRDINEISISINNKYFASSSQDKTCKIWDADSGTCVAVLKGHKRSVWSAKFISNDRYVLTGSSDKTIKMWNFLTNECIKTLEGSQDSIVLLTELRPGFILSALANGSFGIWDYQKLSFKNNFLIHSGKIWYCKYIKAVNQVITAGEDARICFLDDVTDFINTKILKEELCLTSKVESLKILYNKDLSTALEYAIKESLIPQVLELLISNFNFYAKIEEYFDKFVSKISFSNILNIMTATNSMYNLPFAQYLYYHSLKVNRNFFLETEDNTYSLLNDLIARNEKFTVNILSLIEESSIFSLVKERNNIEI